MVENSDSSVLCGYFEKKIGDGAAMMFVNITDPDSDGYYKISVENAEYSFVTVD